MDHIVPFSSKSLSNRTLKQLKTYFEIALNNGVLYYILIVDKVSLDQGKYSQNIAVYKTYSSTYSYIN